MCERYRNAVRLAGFSISLFLLAIVAAPVISAEKKGESDLTAYKELSQNRLETTRDLIQKDIQALSARLDTQDKRLDTQNSQIDQGLSILGTLLSYLGIVLALAGLAGYVSVQSKAKKEAQKEAKATTNEWFERSSGAVQDRLNALQKKLDALETQAESNFSSHMQLLVDRQGLADLAMQGIQQSISETQSFLHKIPAREAKALEEAAQATKNKPETEYTFLDWNYRAFDALSKGDQANAIQYWRAAASSNAATPDARVQALFNAGATLAQLNRHEEAISTFEELIDSFGKSSFPSVERKVAQALNGKIVSLGIMKRYDATLATIDEFLQRFESNKTSEMQEEIRMALYHKAVTFQETNRDDECLATFEEIIKRFESSSNPQAKGWFVAALVSKANFLNKINRHEEALPMFDDVIERFSRDESIEITQEIGKAKNGKGYWLLCKAKENWPNVRQRLDLLEQAYILFSEGAVALSENAFILGNLAYSGHLLDHPRETVKDNLTKAIKFGRKPLYEATLQDLRICPLGEKDNIFRTLLDEIWDGAKTIS